MLNAFLFSFPKADDMDDGGALGCTSCGHELFLIVQASRKGAEEVFVM